MKKSKRILTAFFLVGLFAAGMFPSKAQDILHSDVVLSTTSTPSIHITKPPYVSDSIARPETKFLIGFRFMPTATSLKFKKTSEKAIETSAQFGYGAGGFIGLALGNHVGVQAEVMYTKLAQKFKDGSLDREVNLGYVNIPLMLVLNTGFNKAVNLNLAFGPQLGINTKSKLTTTNTGESETLAAVLKVKKNDLGLAYGAGLDFGFGTEHDIKLAIGYRGVYGLVDISDTSKNLTTNQYYVLDRSRVRTYSGYIGLTFAF